MNKIKRLRWSYVYGTLDIDAPWFWKTDIKVLFPFEGRIFSIGNVHFFAICNCSFGIWVNCDAVVQYSRATMCGLALLVPPPPPTPLKPPQTGTDKKKRASNFGFMRSRRYTISKQEAARRRLRGMSYERITGMLNGNGKLSSVLPTNVCRRDGDVLLRTKIL